MWPMSTGMARGSGGRARRGWGRVGLWGDITGVVAGTEGRTVCVDTHCFTTASHL